MPQNRTTTNFVRFVNENDDPDKIRFLLEAEDYLNRQGITDTTPEELWKLWEEQTK